MLDKSDELAIEIATLVNLKTIRTLLIDLYAKANHMPIKDVEKYTEELNDKFQKSLEAKIF